MLHSPKEKHFSKEYPKLAYSFCLKLIQNSNSHFRQLINSTLCACPNLK